MRSVRSTLREHPLLRLSTAVALALVVSWGAVFAVAQISGSGRVVLSLGAAVVAFLLGARHALDADHVVVIDNISRKLITRENRPASVGFWFALGHSTIVFLAVVAVLLGGRFVAHALLDDGSLVRTAASVWGPACAGIVLLAVGLANVVSLPAIARAFRAQREEVADSGELETALSSRGLGARILRPIITAVDRPEKTYVVGLGMGLGLDTAASVLLLTVAGNALSLPWYAALVLPLLFTAGMLLVDSSDGVLSRFVYTWSFASRRRTLGYSLVITTISVGLAVTVATVSLVSAVQASGVPLSGWLAAVAGVDISRLGIAISIVSVIVAASITIPRVISRRARRAASVA